MKTSFFMIALLISSLSFAANDMAGVKEAVAALKARMLQSGEPKIDGTATVDGKSCPELKFGRTKTANNFDAVDEIKKKFGGTATIFVKDGEDFRRISTNVLKPDGSRAVGTTLAKNKAYEAISKGETFCGDVEILGSPYITCYDPIKAGDAVVGIYYFGYKK